MAERTPGPDDVARFIGCPHDGRNYFDRTVCPDPCNAMHYRCVKCGEAEEPCLRDKLPERGDHHPMIVRWGSPHGMPAEVCDTCSTPEAASWVPIAFCDKARAKSLADPDCAYTYGVIGQRDEDADAE